MELKIIKKPIQDNNTKTKDLEHVTYITENNQLKQIKPTWCVNTSIYREGDGGMKLWFQEIKKVEPDIIYLYEIKSWKDKIVNGLNKDNWFEDILYSVKYDFKKIK